MSRMLNQLITQIYVQWIAGTELYNLPNLQSCNMGYVRLRDVYLRQFSQC